VGWVVLIVCFVAGLERWHFAVALGLGLIYGFLGSYSAWLWQVEVFGPDREYPVEMVFSSVVTSVLIYFSARVLRRWWDGRSARTSK
jgi:hypothetical protein